jgi:hypothetical protein
MLSIDPGDSPGRLPGDQQSVPGEGVPGGGRDPADHEVVPASSLTDIVPPQAMPDGGTIIRPGAIAWGSTLRGEPGGRLPGGRYSSCEAIERALAAVVADPARLPGLLTELAGTRLWIPLPDRRQPLTDGAAVRLPVVGYQGNDFVPCFTSVQRLSAWADQPGAAGQRAGDARDVRTVPHIVVPAVGLAGRLPAGLGLALNPDSAPGLPLYPECVPYLARLSVENGPHGRAYEEPAMEHLRLETGTPLLIGHPPAEPSALLAEARTALRAVPPVSRASRAWLSVPGRGAGLVIAVALDDPTSEQARAAAADAIDSAATAAALRVPFALDVAFTGERVPGARAVEARATEALAAEARAVEARADEAQVVEARVEARTVEARVVEARADDVGAADTRDLGARDPEAAPDAIDDWIARNTRPFYVRA